MKAAVVVDMFGCPNRCKHCWLGHGRNAHVSAEDFVWVAEQFKNYRKDGKEFFNELTFETWYREPDFADNYRDLWELEKRLSTSGEHIHFELASIWRLARDRAYAPWLKSLGVNCVQVTLFGRENNTDYYTGRRGAFSDCMKAIDVLLANGIAPRIQMFPFKTTIGDFEGLKRLLAYLQLEERVRDTGSEFACFLNVLSPQGEAYNLEDIHLNRSELLRLPPYFIEKTLKHFKAENIEKLWPTEAELLPALLEDDAPLNENHPHVAFMVTPEFDVYPNCGEIADWWYLGNLKTKGADVIVSNFINRRNLGLRLNHETPIKYLAAKYETGTATNCGPGLTWLANGSGWRGRTGGRL